MNELQLFEALQGKPLSIGMAVTVSSDYKYSGDWPDKYIVTGIRWDNHRQQFDVTIADNWQDGGTDGWLPCELIPS